MAVEAGARRPDRATSFTIIANGPAALLRLLNLADTPTGEAEAVNTLDKVETVSRAIGRLLLVGAGTLLGLLVVIALFGGNLGPVELTVLTVVALLVPGLFALRENRRVLRIGLVVLAVLLAVSVVGTVRGLTDTTTVSCAHDGIPGRRWWWRKGRATASGSSADEAARDGEAPPGVDGGDGDHGRLRGRHRPDRQAPEPRTAVGPARELGRDRGHRHRARRHRRNRPPLEREPYEDTRPQGNGSGGC